MHCYSNKLTFDLMKTYTGNKVTALLPWQPISNAVTGVAMPVITNEFTKVIQVYQWGLVPKWAKLATYGKNLYNTKLSNLQKSTSMAAILQYNRCLIPATSFKIWIDKKRGIEKEIYAPNNLPMYLCGIWDVWGEGLYTYSVLTHNSYTKLPDAYLPYPIQWSDKKVWLNSEAIGWKELLEMETVGDFLK